MTNFILFQEIFIYRRPIWDIHINAFQSLQNLQNFIITFCQLTEAPPKHPLSRTLRMLNLKANNITHIPSEYFRGFDMLEEINLGLNRLTSLPEMHYLNATLIKFMLTQNQVADITPLYFVPMVALRTLTLGYNNIKYISFENATWPDMTILDLTHNLLTTIKPFRQVKEGTTKILLEGNPFHCDSELCWLTNCMSMKIKDLSTIKVICSPNLRAKLMYYDIYCKSPDERRGMAMQASGKELNGLLKEIYHDYLNLINGCRLQCGAVITRSGFYRMFTADTVRARYGVSL